MPCWPASDNSPMQRVAAAGSIYAQPGIRHSCHTFGVGVPLGPWASAVRCNISVGLEHLQFEGDSKRGWEPGSCQRWDRIPALPSSSRHSGRMHGGATVLPLAAADYSGSTAMRWTTHTHTAHAAWGAWWGSSKALCPLCPEPHASRPRGIAWLDAFAFANALKR